MSEEPDTEERACAWRNSVHDEFCDSIEPWEYGTVVRASDLPDYWDFNVVRVERPCPLGVDELVAIADAGLDGLGHRKLDIDPPDVAERLRPGFDARGWNTSALVWMRFEGAPAADPAIAVEEVSYDAVHALRLAWHEEDFPGIDQGDYYSQSRAVSLRRGVRVYAAVEDGEPVAFAELERRGSGAEIVSVYVAPEHRCSGRGTAITRAAIEAGRDADDLWIVADAEGRPKDLYARLGFVPAWTSAEALRPPS